MRGFWLGLACGVLLAGMAVAGAARYAARNGLTVAMEAAPLAAVASSAVEEAVDRHLPEITAPLRQRIPAAMAAILTRRLQEAGITVYGVRLELPPAAAHALEEQLQAELARQLEAELDPGRLESLVESWSRQMGQALVGQLADRLASRPVSVRPVDRLPLAIPVFIRLEGAAAPARGPAGPAAAAGTVGWPGTLTGPGTAPGGAGRSPGHAPAGLSSAPEPVVLPFRTFSPFPAPSPGPSPVPAAAGPGR